MTTNCQHEFDAIDLPCAYCGKTKVQIQIEEAFERVKIARKELISKRRKKYTKLDCVAKEGSHYAKPYRDD